MSLNPFSNGAGRTHNAHAVVSGAGSGIGRAFATELARRGARVVCTDISRARAEDTAVQIRNSGGRAVGLACDVANADEVAAVADAAERWFGQPVDLLINNAGVGAGGAPVGEITLEDWQWVLGVNMWGVIHGCQVFTPRLRAAGHGGIINVASAASFAAAPGMGAYNVSKAAVLALSETMAAELAGSGVAISVLCPTFVKTNITVDGRISGDSAQLAATLMKWTGKSASGVARTTLDAHDRGELYVLPQLDARLVWSLKRHIPRAYVRGLGLIQRTGLVGAHAAPAAPAAAAVPELSLAAVTPLRSNSTRSNPTRSNPTRSNTGA